MQLVWQYAKSYFYTKYWNHFPPKIVTYNWYKIHMLKKKNQTVAVIILPNQMIINQTLQHTL